MALGGWADRRVDRVLRGSQSFGFGPFLFKVFGARRSWNEEEDFGECENVYPVIFGDISGENAKKAAAAVCRIAAREICL